MAKTKETEASVTQAANLSVQARDRDRKGLIKKFMSEPKVQVSVSPLYKPYYGSTVLVSNQGISVYVPANGRTYSIPKTFAGVLYDSIASIDARIQKTQRMSNVSENFEESAGALRF